MGLLFCGQPLLAIPSCLARQSLVILFCSQQLTAINSDLKLPRPAELEGIIFCRRPLACDLNIPPLVEHGICFLWLNPSLIAFFERVISSPPTAREPTSRPLAGCDDYFPRPFGPSVLHTEYVSSGSDLFVECPVYFSGPACLFC